MTFVHSCGNLGLWLSGYGLDRRGDFMGIIELREPVLPWAILFPMPFAILIQEESEEGPRVRVLRIWHGSRDRLTTEDIETVQ